MGHSAQETRALAENRKMEMRKQQEEREAQEENQRQYQLLRIQFDIDLCGLNMMEDQALDFSADYLRAVPRLRGLTSEQCADRLKFLEDSQADMKKMMGIDQSGIVMPDGSPAVKRPEEAKTEELAKSE